MSKDLTEAEEALAQQNYELGIIVGTERTSSKCRTLAGQHFSQHNDEPATFCRSVAEWLEKDARELRAEYDRKWHKEADKTSAAGSGE